MKKIVLNISDIQYEKFRFEALHQQKSIQEIIKERLFYKDFDIEVIECFENWLNQQIEYIIKE